MEKGYLEFLTELKTHIVQSRYVAAKLVNREQLQLYCNIGKMLSAKIAAEQWGTNIMERVATDLQTKLPGLRGFWARNLRNMRQFYEEYREIWQTVSAKLGEEGFWRISFSHHMLLIFKGSSLEERLFYIEKAATEFWSFRVLEHQVRANLFQHRGNCPAISVRRCQMN